MAIVDWPWWIAGGGFLLGGLYLLWRALIADRARGRRRCKHCWYDMSGTPSLRCPECGREAKREKQLFKTRRHWRLAALSLLLLLIGWAAFFGREVHRHGWINATPTVFYIAFAPQLKNGTTFDELINRVGEGDLRQWEYRLLVHRCVGALRKNKDPQALMNLVAILERIEIGGRNLKDDRPWASWALVSEIDHKGAIDALAALTQSDDLRVRVAAIDALGQFTEQAIPAFPVLVGLLASSDAQVLNSTGAALRFLGHHNTSGLYFPGTLRMTLPGRPVDQPSPEEIEFYKAMAACSTHAEKARAALIDALTSRNSTVRAASVFGLAVMHPDDPAVQERILSMADDRDEVVRATAVAATAAFPFTDAVKETLDKAMADSSGHVLRSALAPLALRGHAASMYAERVRKLMIGFDDEFAATQAACCFVSIGGDADAAVDVLLSRMQSNSQPHSWGGTTAQIVDGLGRLGDLGVQSSRACRELRPLMESNDPDSKSAAAVAYVKLDGEDLDVATRAIFEALYAAPRGGFAFSRWFWFANHGRISTAVMKEMLGSSTAAHRANAVRFLGEVGAPARELLPEMRRLLEDPDPTVRDWADLAVRRVEYLTTHDR